MSKENKANWIIGPIGWCIKYIGEETILAALTTKSIIAFEHQETLLSIAREKLEENEISVKDIDHLIALAPEHAEWASKQKNIDFSDINRHSLISVWGALETCLEETIVLILQNDQKARQSVKRLGIKIKKGTENRLSEYEARRIYSGLIRKFRKNFSVADAYIEILKLFEVDINCPQHILEKLAEIKAVRNCLVHNADKINKRAVREASTLKKLLGKEIRISRNLYSEYFEAISNFTQSMLKGIVKCKYITVKKS